MVSHGVFLLKLDVLEAARRRRGQRNFACSEGGTRKAASTPTSAMDLSLHSGAQPYYSGAQLSDQFPLCHSRMFLAEIQKSDVRLDSHQKHAGMTNRITDSFFYGRAGSDER
jgi:hypothetical protein